MRPDLCFPAEPMPRNVFMLVVLMFALGAAQSAVARAPKFPAPPDAAVSWVGQNMIVNSIPMQIRRFTTGDGVQDVVDFYRRKWGDGTPGKPEFVVNTLVEPWFIISRVEDGHLMTVQVQHAANRGAWGYLAMSEIPDASAKVALGKNFPSMRGSKTVNETVTKDPGKSGRTMMLSNEYTVSNNVEFYRDHFDNNGWAFDMDSEMGTQMHVLALRKGRQKLNLVISNVDGGKTIIVVNEERNDLL